MNKEEVQKMIDDAIREYETRVGWISGIAGIMFTFGIMHSIWLLKQ